MGSRRIISDMAVVSVFNYYFLACPGNLWGSECRMSCACNNRGMCSPVNGSCDCDPGWRSTDCGEGKYNWMR